MRGGRVSGDKVNVDRYRLAAFLQQLLCHELEIIKQNLRAEKKMART
jgi:hypothetical protein